MENQKYENKKVDPKQSTVEGLLLLSVMLIMAGLTFVDNDPNHISKNEIVGLCISGSGFLIILCLLIYFVFYFYLGITWAEKL